MKHVGTTPDGYELIAIKPADLSALKIAIEMLACIFADKDADSKKGAGVSIPIPPEAQALRCADAAITCPYQERSTSPATCCQESHWCTHQRMLDGQIRPRTDSAGALIPAMQADRPRMPRSLPRENSATKTPPRRAARNVASKDLAVARPVGGRPKQITCTCGKTVKVGKFGHIPTRCPKCRKAAGYQAKKAAGKPAKKTAERTAPHTPRTDGAPCTVCGGPVDRFGSGGYERSVCAACESLKPTPSAPSAAPASPSTAPDAAKFACRSCREPLKTDESGLCKKCLEAARKLRDRVGKTTADDEGGAS